MSNPLELVNTFLGIDGEGNCLPGPYRPFGMVRLSPDTKYPQRTGGYTTGEPVLRFSHTHVAGTGGGSRYGNVGVIPFCGDPKIYNMKPWIVPPYINNASRKTEQEDGAVGYYKAVLQPFNVTCEHTTTQHTGIHRYTFPGEKESWILVDAGAVIQVDVSVPGQICEVEEWDSTGESTGGFIEQINEYEIRGCGEFIGGWGHDKPYAVYFYLKFDKPVINKVTASAGGISDAEKTEGAHCRTALYFGKEKELNLQVGISFNSCDSAKQYIERESEERTFEEIRTESEQEWLKILDTFNVSGGDEEQRNIFYSLLHRIFCLPTDLGTEDENPYKEGVRQFTDYYCLWDSIRNANSFYHLFFPEVSRDMMNSLLQIGEKTGWLPDVHVAGNHGYMQSACACDILFTEAAEKGIEGVDYRKALELVKKNTLEKSPDILTKGRYITDYHELGYLSTNVPKGSVSRHIEYTYHDWCIGRLAEILGDENVAEEFYAYSDRLWNLWRDDLRCFGPRSSSGDWVDFDPDNHVSDGWNDLYTYEGTCRIWSFNGFHHIYGMIERCGGDEAFVTYLDEIFEKGLFAVKETRMHFPHLYTYAGRPDKAGEKVLESLTGYSDSRDGLPDNEDMGCQSGYFLFNSMGIYPIYGQAHYMLTPPLFDSISCRLQNGTLNIKAEREGAGTYITGAKLNRETLDRAWITHSEIVNGADLVLSLADSPTDWGRDNRPPCCRKN